MATATPGVIENYFHIFYGNVDGKDKEITIPGKNNIVINKGENLPPFDNTNVHKSVDYLVESIRNRIDESKKKSYDVYDTLISQSKSQESILMNTAQYIKERRGANLVGIKTGGTPEEIAFLKQELKAHSKGLDTFQTVITQQELQYHTLMVSEILKEIDAYKNGVFSSGLGKQEIENIEKKCTDLQGILVSSQNPDISVEGIFNKKDSNNTDLKKDLGTFGNIVTGELKTLEDGVMDAAGEGEIKKFFEIKNTHNQNRNVKVFLNSLKTLLLNIQKRTHSYDYVEKAISKAQGILDLAIVEDDVADAAGAGAGTVLTPNVATHAQNAINAVKTVLDKEYEEAIIAANAAERNTARLDAEKFKYAAKAQAAAGAAVAAAIAAQAGAAAAGAGAAAARAATQAAVDAVNAAGAADAAVDVATSRTAARTAETKAQEAETKAQEAVYAATRAGVALPIVVPRKNAVVVNALRTLVAELETEFPFTDKFTDNQNILTLLTTVDERYQEIVNTAQITGKLKINEFKNNIIQPILLPFKNIVKKMYKHKQELLQKANIARYVEKDIIKANKLVSDAYTIFDVPLLTTEDPLLQDIIQLGKLSGLITYYYEMNIANGNLNDTTGVYLKNGARQTLRTAAIATTPPDATHFTEVGNNDKLGTYDIENIVIQPFYEAQIKFMGYCENQKQLLHMFSEDMKKRASMVGAKSKIKEGYIYGENIYYPLKEYVTNLSRDMDVPQMCAIEQTKINTEFISGSNNSNNYKFGTIEFPKNDQPTFRIKVAFSKKNVKDKTYKLDKKTVEDITAIILINPKNKPLLTNIIQDAKKSRISTFIELVKSDDNEYIDSQYNHIKDLFIKYISKNPTTLITKVDEASVQKWVTEVKETYFNQLDSIIVKTSMDANDKILVQEYIRNLETKIPVLLIHNMFEHRVKFGLGPMFEKISSSQ